MDARKVTFYFLYRLVRVGQKQISFQNQIWFKFDRLSRQ